MTTRRNILKGGAGIAAILASGKAPAYIVKSMLAARNGIGMRVGGAKLPYDAEVEYLESTGTQYIDSGVDLYGATSFGYDICATCDNVTAEQRFFSTEGSSPTYDLYLTQTSVVSRPSQTTMSYRQGDVVRAVYINGVIELYSNGTLAAQMSNPFTQVANHRDLYLMVRANNLSSSYHLKGKTYYAKVWIDGILVRDLIPVRFTNELGQSEGAMYDRVSGQLFRNQGTGAFLYGADKIPIETNRYVQDGLVAMWDGKENVGVGLHDANATEWKDLIGNRDWTLGTSTSYEWTANSFDAKDQFAATQDFIDGSLVNTVEVCAKIKTKSTWKVSNFAFIIIGRIKYNLPYYGLLYRNSGGVLALMGGRSYFAGTVSEFAGVPASFSFPNYATIGVSGYFDGISRDASGYNSLDYNSTTRGTVARIGGTAQQPMPIEVYNIRLYSRTLAAAEIAANYAVDKARFNLA